MWEYKVPMKAIISIPDSVAKTSERAAPSDNATSEAIHAKPLIAVKIANILIMNSPAD